MTIFIPIWLIIILAWIGYIFFIALAIALTALACGAAFYWSILTRDHYMRTRGIYQLFTKWMYDNPDLVQQAREGKLK